MKGSVIINGVDIGNLGMFILRGGDFDFLPFPERKQPPTNSWFEYHGVDVDLAEVFFKERTVTIHFYIAAPDARTYEFYLSEFYRLIASGYVQLYSREFERTFTLRYLNCPELDHRGGLYKSGTKSGKLKVEFSMDDPLQLFTDPTILQPRKLGSLLAIETALMLTDDDLFIDLGDTIATDTHISHVAINGIDLGAFGIVVSECYNSLLKLPALKAPLTRSFARRSGLQAHPSKSPKLEQKEIIIKCTMWADSRPEFYYNYEALFNQLAIPEALQIDCYLGRAHCYYSKMTDFKKMGIFSRGVKVQFSLHLIQTDPSFAYFVLGTVSDIAILTDVNEYILI